MIITPEDGQTPWSLHYAYNLAGQRTNVVLADEARWEYGYDSLGQLTSGKKRWKDHTFVSGEQFEYDFDPDRYE